MRMADFKIIFFFLFFVNLNCCSEGRGQSYVNNPQQVTPSSSSSSNKDSISKMIITTSNIYRDAAFENEKEKIDYENALLSQLHWTAQDVISIVKYIDSGRFSTVFEGRMVEGKRTSNDYDSDNTDTLESQHGTDIEIPIVLKVLKPTFVGKIKREIKLLELLRGTDGVINLLGVSKNSGCQTVTLIFESLGSNAQWCSHSPNFPFTSQEVQLIAYKLLLALDSCHSKGVMHRDIKPRNVIYERKEQKLRIIDFGLSDLYFPGKEYNPSVASRHFKGPELLFG